MAEKSSENDLQTLRDDMATLRADFKKFSDDLKVLGRGQADAARDELGETAERMREEFRRILDETGTRGRQSLETVESEIGARPLTSVLISFGAGLLLAKLLERK